MDSRPFNLLRSLGMTDSHIRTLWRLAQYSGRDENESRLACAALEFFPEYTADEVAAFALDSLRRGGSFPFYCAAYGFAGNSPAKIRAEVDGGLRFRLSVALQQAHSWLMLRNPLLTWHAFGFDADGRVLSAAAVGDFDSREQALEFTLEGSRIHRAALQHGYGAQVLLQKFMREAGR